MRGRSRVSLHSCAPRSLLLCATGCLSRGSTRRPTRAQPLHGANRHGRNHLQRHGSHPSDQPFDHIECQFGPKIPHDPASFVAGAPPGSVGQKKKMKKPRPSPAGPQKNPCTHLSAHANILGSPAQGGLKNAKLPHGRAIETAHDDTPKTKMSSRCGAASAHAANAGVIQLDRLGCLYAISQLARVTSRFVACMSEAIFGTGPAKLAATSSNPPSGQIKRFERHHGVELDLAIRPMRARHYSRRALTILANCRSRR